MTAAELAAAGVAPVDEDAARGSGAGRLRGRREGGRARAARLRPARADQRQRLRRRADRHRQRHGHASRSRRATCRRTSMLGIVNVPGLDASDRDSAINISSWPVFGMYEPDAIASFKAGTQDYLITANEGDARDWPGFSEEARVGSLTLDPTAFPNAAALKNNANLGRLNVTQDARRHGRRRRLRRAVHAGRALVLHLEHGRRAGVRQRQRLRAHRRRARSGVLQRQQRRPHLRQPLRQQGAGAGSGRPSARSASARYAFIGLERMGGIMVYDVTEPDLAGVRRLREQPRLHGGSGHRAGREAISGPKA